MKNIINKYFRKDNKVNVCFIKCKRCPSPIPFCCIKFARCERQRVKLSREVYVSTNGAKYIFINQLTTFPPKPCEACESLFCGDYRPVTVEELMAFNKWLKVDGKPLCSMLVWATRNGVPTLVRVRPGKRKPVKLVRTPSLNCLAYSICISPPCK